MPLARETMGQLLARLPRRIHEVADRWIIERPNAPALIEPGGRTLGWREFGAVIDSAAEHLGRVGVRKGNRVLIVFENCIAAASFLMACSRLEACAVLVNARLAAPEIDGIRRHCAPRAIVCAEANSPDASRHADRCDAAAVQFEGCGPMRIAGHLPHAPGAPGTDGDVAVMLYTSGTTGKPKGVMLTHRNVLFIAAVSGACRSLGADDLVYLVLPMSHVFGFSSTFLGTVYAGGALQLVPRFDPAHLARALADGVTVFQGVPAMYARLLDYLDAAGEPAAAPRLRYLSCGGAPLDLALKERVECRFGIALNNGYGLTEASPTVAQTLIHDRRSDDSVGPPLPGLEIRIVDGSEREVPAGDIGELWVRGPSVMQGYYRDAAGTAAVLAPDGWLRTGDLARRAADGNLYIVGRVKELIIRSGFKVYPAEVEMALNAHPAVAQSAVVGRRVRGNEEIVAFVERGQGNALDEGALRSFLAERLAPYKRPQHIFLVDRMPASATGKIQKHALAAWAERLIAQEAK